MTNQEAHQIISLIEDQWRRQIGPSKPIWLKTITEYEWVVAVNAVYYLADRKQFCPSLAELREVLAMMYAKHRPALPPAPDEDVQAPGPSPEWINIWAWMRLTLGDFRALPQQAAVADQVLSAEEYDELRSRWVAAGEPRMSSDDLVAAMQANRAQKAS